MGLFIPKNLHAMKSPVSETKDPIARILNYVSKIFKTMWLYIAGILAVGGLYYLLTGLDQGIDVLIQAGEFRGPFFFTMLALPLSAGALWYSGRLLSYIKQHRDYNIHGGSQSEKSDDFREYCIPASHHRNLPRYIGFNLFVAIQAAIFQLPIISPGPVGNMLLFIVLHNVLYFFLGEWIQRRADRQSTGFFNLIVIPVGAYVAYLLWRMSEVPTEIMDNLWAHTGRFSFWLLVVALVAFVMEVGWIFFVIWRRRVILEQPYASPIGGRHSSRVLEWFGVNDHFLPNEIKSYRRYLVLLVIVLLVYFSAVSSMFVADRMGPLAFALLAVGVLTAIINFISAFSIRYSFNFFVMLFIIGIVVGFFHDPYGVRILPAKGDKEISRKRPTMDNAIARWFSFPGRDSLIKSYNGKPFPVYIVLSNGGASRAGSWTTRVLSYLQDSSVGRDSTDQFKDHILCLAGASGGTIGNSAFYSMLKAERSDSIKSNEFSLHTRKFFDTDFLTYTLAHLLGPDLFRHTLPFAFWGEDRATALERVMTYGPQDCPIGQYFEMPISNVFDRDGALPIYFINTTQVDTGMPAVISSAQLTPSWQRLDVLTLVDQMGSGADGGDMRLSTASVLSSRFPYVSPAGKVFDRYFVDGGYFDNSGAGTVYEFLQDLETYLDKNPEINKLISLKILQITNSEQLLKPTPSIHPLTNDVAAPLLTLAGMQGASTKISTGILKRYFRNFNKDPNAFVLYSLYDTAWSDRAKKGEYEPGFPMSWVISDYQFSRMEKALQRENGIHEQKFYFQR